MPSKYGNGQHGNYRRNYSTPRFAMAEPHRRFASTPSSPDNEPFFASNLRYYPHLPQPLWVGHYQTYSEIKEFMSKGKHSKFGQHGQQAQQGPQGQQGGRFISRGSFYGPQKAGPSRRQLTAREEPTEPPIRRFQKKKTPEVNYEPASQAPNRRYSVTRKNGGHNGMALANLILSASSHLLRQPYPEIQRQIHKPLKKPVQDPLLAQFKARQEELQRGAGGDLSNKPRRLQPGWCSSYVDSKASKDAPLSWRSNTQQPVKKSAPKYA
nr:uncharacterized protein LOC108063786 [Drosophila takahashii]